MKKGLKSGFVSRTGAAALTLCLLAGNAQAGASCAASQDVTALRVAALRQKLMVAALTCHRADAFNRFVISRRDELQDSDHALMTYFDRGHGGDDGYNAYKTRLANDYSLRSLRDPEFCRSAEAVFDVALNRNLSLSELVSERAARVATGFTQCTGRETTEVALDMPAPPARHPDLLSDARVPELTPPPDHIATPPDAPAVPAMPQPHSDAFTDAPAPRAEPTPPSQSDMRDDESSGDDVDDDRDDREAYAGGPYPQWDYPAYGAPYAGADAYGPPRQVQGSDGRWYLMPMGY